MIERWEEARTVLEELLDLAPETQAARLAALREHDPGLAEIVRDLLELDDVEADDARPDEGARREVGRFHLRHRIATGRLGSVWAAARNDGAFDQDVVIKLIDIESMARELGVAPAQALGHERRLLARIDSPHVVRLIDAGELDGSTEWLALEAIEGEPLLGYCQRRQLDVDARVELVQQIARGIEACHRAGVWHLDLSPANVLVTGAAEVKIIDFASSWSEDAVGEAHIPRGGFTPAYAAPERFEEPRQSKEPGSEADVGASADVWSLGAILHELLTGKLPIEIAHLPPSEARRRKLTEDPARMRGVSSDLEAVTLAALRRSPSRRTKSALDFREDLERWRRGDPVRARRETLTRRAARLARRKPRAVAAMLAVGGALFVGATALYWGSVQARRATEKTLELERIETERIASARRTSETLVRQLYVAISPLAGTHEQVGRLLDAGIEVARSADDGQLSMWLGDALVKRALHEIETPRWSPEVEWACLAACERALQLVGPMRASDPKYFEAARVMVDATQLSSLSYFNLCDRSACREAMRSVREQLGIMAATMDDPFAAIQVQAMRLRANSVQNFYDEAWGQFERVLETDRESLAIFDELESASHLSHGLKSQQLSTRIEAHHLTYLADADPAAGPLLLEAALEDAEQLFELVSERPTVELLITRSARAAMTLSEWLRGEGDVGAADDWLRRALAAARAPGVDRRESALRLVAKLEAELALTDHSAAEGEIQSVTSADTLVRRAWHELAKGETLEATRLASRAATLYDGVVRSCDDHVTTQRSRAELEAIQGEVERHEAMTRTGDARRVSLERAERRLARAWVALESIGGDPLYRKSIARGVRRIKLALDECREQLAR